MKLADERIIAAPPATVWAALLDPEVLKACIPGCDSMTGSPESGFEAVVVQKVGPVKARFTGMVTLTDITPGEAVTITGEGKGGPAGFAKGSARVGLRPVEEGTALTYEVEANVGGKLAQLGSRIIDSFARNFADDFFRRFQTAIEGPQEAETMPDPAAAAAGEPAPETQRKSWLKRLTGG